MRNKLSIVLILLSLGWSYSSANNIVTIKIDGDLDDDLFILKSSFQKVDFLDCLQMHNPTDKFLYDGKIVKSEKIYGMIDFKKSYFLNADETLLVMTANEREEINPKRVLLKRTHFKSVNLYSQS